MEISGAPGYERSLASGVAARLERLIGLFRSLSPADGLSLTAAATLATLERSGPQRLTALAVHQGVTQPAMTQLIGRLQEAGLAGRAADPADGRVVQVRLTDQGRDLLARRRAARAERLAALLARISPEDRAALGAALPAIDALVSAHRDASIPPAASAPASEPRAAGTPASPPRAAVTPASTLPGAGARGRASLFA